MTVRTLTAVIVECDYRDGDTRCDSQLPLRAADPVDVDRNEWLIAAANRHWDVYDGEFCPKHRPHPTTAAAPTAETGA